MNRSVKLLRWDTFSGFRQLCWSAVAIIQCLAVVVCAGLLIMITSLLTFNIILLISCCQQTGQS